jgi:hypothetical protein
MQGSETIHFDDAEESNPATHGNRPAAGARQTSLEEALAQGLVGSTPNQSGDFLGLSDELPPAPAEAVEPPAPAPYAPPPAYAAEPPPSPFDTALPPPPAAAADEFAEEPKRSPARIYALAGVAGLLAVVGVGIVLRRGSEPDGAASNGGAQGHEIAALAPRDPAQSGDSAGSAAAHRGVGQAESAGPARDGEARATGAADGYASQVPDTGASKRRPRAASPGLVTTLGDAIFGSGGSGGASAVDSDSLAYQMGEAVGAALVASSLGADALAGSAYAAPAPASAPRVSQPRPVNAAQPARPEGTEVYPPSLSTPIGGADVAMIWQAESVPMEHLGAAGRLLTPSVGQVRIVRQSGDLFEGRLYAVGQGKIWLDTESGRIVLDAKATSAIDRMEAGAPKGAQALKGERVCARTIGGPIFGRLVAQDGDRVTLITDEGAKLVLTGATVEPAKSNSAIKLNH